MAEQAISGLTTYNQDKPAIMIADNSRVVRASFKQILKNDYQLIEAEDGLQAWERLLEHPDIRLIFSELSMPRLDGKDLLQKIRQSEINRIRNLPFIVVTGKKKGASIRQILQDTGATEVINKPFDPASIISFASTLASKPEEESYFILGEELDQSQFLPGIIGQSQFMEIAGKELSFAIRNKNELALALLKIDQFEPFSTHYSEPAIEHILQTTAEIMRQHIHPDDTIAYFGEGLFAILRPASNTIGTRYIGRRILEDLKAKQFYLAESDKALGASIGISAPEIKHGTRLRELLLLAEARLKAAIDLGGDRVIDKGNDTLTPVSSPDTLLNLSEHSRFNTHTAANSPEHSHSARSEVIPAEAQGDEAPLEPARQITKLRTRLELLTQENKGLQEQVERWRKQSAEPEQLRQRIFELESEQQQMQLKFSQLNAENLQLHKQTEQAEREIQQLTKSEEERSEALKQANQFYAEENLRLEGQLDVVNERVREAESTNLKSEDLIVSLKDDISLLRSQLAMVQEELMEAQGQPQVVVSAPPEAKEANQVSESQEDTLLIHKDESNLLLDGFPSSKQGRQKKAPVVEMFPPKEAEMKAASKPEKKVETVKESFTLPVYRIKEDSTFRREWRPLSSFTIASLLLLLLLASGGGYLYSYLKLDSPLQASPAKPRTETAKPAGAMQAPPFSQDPAAIPPKSGSNPTFAPVATSRETRPQPSSTLSKVESPLSEEARLQVELTLRQKAEEAFNQQLLQMENSEQ